ADLIRDIGGFGQQFGFSFVIEGRIIAIFVSQGPIQLDGALDFHVLASDGGNALGDDGSLVGQLHFQLVQLFNLVVEVDQQLFVVSYDFLLVIDAVQQGGNVVGLHDHLQHAQALAHIHAAES